MAASVMRRLITRIVEYVQEPTAAGQVRRQVLFHIPIPILILGVLALVLREWSAPGWTILLSTSVAVGSLLLACFAQPTPLPEGVPPEVSVRRSLHRFRQITGLRIGLALTPVVMGVAASIVGGGLFPYAVAFVLAWPQLLLAWPGYFTVSRARRAMEAWGTKAYLWAALAQPARVEWPLITRLHDWWRRRRAAARGEAPAPRRPKPQAKRNKRPDNTTAQEVCDLPGVPERLAPPKTPATPVEAVVPGFSRSPARPSGPAGGSVLRLPVQLQLLRLRANTRPKTRGDRAEQRQRTKNSQGN